MKKEASSLCLGITVLVIGLFLTSNGLLAQVSNIGEVRSWKKTDNGLEG